MSLQDFNIVCTADVEYLPMAKCFLESLKQNSPGPVVHIRLINCTAEQRQEISNIYDNTRIICDKKKLSTKRCKIQKNNILLQEKINDGFKDRKTKYRGARWLYSEKMAYCSNIKFNTINTLLQDGVDNFFYFDIDCIVRKNLVGLYNIIKNNDLVFRVTEMSGTLKQRFNAKTPRVCYPRWDRDVMYHGGMFGATNNKTTRTIFKKIESIIESDMFDWDIDEIAIHDTVETHKSDITIHRLEDIYKDERKREKSSIVWSGAGPTKYTDAVYVEEARTYNVDI